MNKYRFYFFGALFFCSFFIFAAYFRGYAINYYSLVFSFVFGLVFVPFVVIKLPIFRGFYNSSCKSKSNDFANRQAAPVMVSLVTGSVTAALLYLIGSESIELSSFCSAISAGIVSVYYEPRFWF
jgi:hypothetical protein